MPWGPSWTATERTNPITPALAVAYAVRPYPRSPAIDDTQITAPPPRRAIAGTAACVARNIDLRSTAMTRSHSSSVVSSRPLRDSMPTLLWRMSTPPQRSTAALTIAAHSAARVTSAAWAVVLPPSARIAATVSSARSFIWSAHRTFAPSRAKSRAVALPFPRPGPREPAPVTIAILPLSRPLMSRRPPRVGLPQLAIQSNRTKATATSEVTHVRGVRAQVRRAGHDGLPVLLPRGIARADHAPLLRLADPRWRSSDPRGHRVPRRRRAGARDPGLREPGGDGRARGREAGGRARGAHHAPPLRPLGRAQSVPRRGVLDPAGRGGLLDWAVRPRAGVPPIGERRGARAAGDADLCEPRPDHRRRPPGAPRDRRPSRRRPHRGAPDRHGPDPTRDGRAHLRCLALLPQRGDAPARPDRHEPARDARGLRDDPRPRRRRAADRRGPRSLGRRPVQAGRAGDHQDRLTEVQRARIASRERLR